MGDSVFIRTGTYSDRIRKALKFMNPKREQALSKAASILHEAGWSICDTGLAVEIVIAEHLSNDEGYRSSVRRPREILEEETAKTGFDEELGG